MLNISRITTITTLRASKQESEQMSETELRKLLPILEDEETSDALGAFEEALFEVQNRGYSPRLAIIGSNVFFDLLRQLWRMGQLGAVPEKISNCPVVLSRAIDPDVIEIVFNEDCFESYIVKLKAKRKRVEDKREEEHR